MTSGAVLASDPVFQLNVLLWALEDLPSTMAVRPVLREAGYRVESLGRRLLVPADRSTASALRALTGSEDRSPCHPDLCVDHPEEPVTLVIELKSRGFSGGSSNVRQAVKLIVASHDLSESYAETKPRPGQVLYGTVESDADDLDRTLQDLSRSVASHDAPTVPVATMGISVDEDGARLSAPSPASLPGPARRALQASAIVLHRYSEDDIEPLYLVPWIPGIAGTQDPELQSDGYSQLTARIIVEAMAIVGRATIPTTLEITGEQLLGRATFGVYDRWIDTDRCQFAMAAISVLANALQSVSTLQERKGTTLRLSISSRDEQAAIMSVLEQANPADKKTNLEVSVNQPPTLFDDP